MQTEATVHRVGQIPNVLALAHYLTTTPLIADRVVFIIVPEARDRLALCQLLKLLDSKHRIIEWHENDPFSIQALANSDRIICDVAQFAEQTLPSPKILNAQTQMLSVGEVYGLSALKDFLTLAGYERETTANTPGGWATRGEIIDVYTTAPFRIAFEGDRIEYIHTFDIASGKKQKEHSSLSLPPLGLVGRSTIVHHLPHNALVVNFHGEEITCQQEQYVIEPFILDAHYNAHYTESASYHLRYTEIEKDIAKAKKAYIITSEPEKAEAFASHATIIPTEEYIPIRGTRNTQDDVLILTDVSIGFAEQKAKKKNARLTQQLLQQLTPGDFIVHMYHGVAKFVGMKMMHVNDLDREYIILEYAQGDKIYLPVELAERIDKYVGAENPSLHRLSDASWNEAVARVKEQSLQMARELLNLYAQREQSHAPQMIPYPQEEKKFDEIFHYDLTEDQSNTLKDIFHDIAQQKPMDRLLCGDVGFGKTEVAMRAALRVVQNGYQVAVLAPTTVLVQQHFDTFVERFKQFNITVRMLSRIQTDAEQQKIIQEMQAGKAHIVVGTHRLLSRDVAFRHLGLLVVDEEQRFGVKAKEKLKNLRKNAHVLTMTATPIPRTLHFSLTGIRDISTILTPPTGRQESQITITRFSEERIKKALEYELQRGGQAYYVYNRVQTIHHRERSLRSLLPTAKIGVAHGQMKPQELSAVMHAFDTGEIDILLATTIVENGLDIPNANTLIVENASQFGLSELYQLKGRVGRSHTQGYAYFFYKEQLPDGDAKKRFIALQDAQHLGAGFELAMRDMEIRGVGNMLGREQHGNAVKIGVNLYVRLLNQAMREMQGIEEEPLRDIPIDLPIEARIPEEAISDISERIMLYQRIANIQDYEELVKKRAALSLEDRFHYNGKFHPAMEGLFDLLEIKLLSSHSSLLSIDTAYPNTTNRLHSPRITLTSEKIFHSIDPVWEIMFTREEGVYKIRATLDTLGDDWVEKIKTVLQSHSSTHTPVSAGTTTE